MKAEKRIAEPFCSTWEVYVLTSKDGAYGHQVINLSIRCRELYRKIRSRVHI